jgi:hypothetical protein
MMEVGVVVGLDGTALHWHLPLDRHFGALPDSRGLWDVLWAHRDQLLGVAHSHPGVGWPAPSWTDVTTFAAIEGALGKRLTWWITSANRLIAVTWRGPEKFDYVLLPLEDDGATWLDELRRLTDYRVPRAFRSRETL